MCPIVGAISAITIFTIRLYHQISISSSPSLSPPSSAFTKCLDQKVEGHDVEVEVEDHKVEGGFTKKVQEIIGSCGIVG